METNNRPLQETGYQCFHCGHYTVYWSGDFMFDEYRYEGNGIIHECHCMFCNADITYMIPIEEDNDQDDQKTDAADSMQ